MTHEHMEGASLQSHREELINSTGDNSEDTLLIEKKVSSCWSVLAVRYRTTRKCISSKAALLILFWSLAVALANGLVANPDTFMQMIPYSATLVAYGCIPFVLIFYPLAGFLADVKFGRSKTIFKSLYLIIPALVITLVATGVGVTLVTTLPEEKSVMIILFTISIIMLVIAGIAFIVILAGFTGFTANVIQFGMDQLHDSPGEDRTLFIHWYVWIYYVSMFITQFAWNLLRRNITGENNTAIYGLPAVIQIIVTVLLIFSVCLGHCRRRWFLIEPGRVNPYKLVYRVSKFAYQHRTPVNRSAFTYCEDEIPSGLDLGKDKYGGPFTTEEVEDVKAFYGILKVLFSFGLVLPLDFGANSLKPLFHYYVIYDGDPNSPTQLILLKNGVLSPLLIVVCIPLYIFILCPFISYYIPGMLKRMGIGMCFVVLSLVMSFSIEAAYYMENNLCNKDDYYIYYYLYYGYDYDYYYQHHSHYLINGTYSSPRPPPPLSLSNTILVAQNILSALSNMLIYIAVFEFICSQSPHSMKGLLIGLWYAIKGLYQMLAAVLTIPYIMLWSEPSHSCGFGYFLMNIIIGVFALLVYVCVARRYKYRERDEPCHVRRYAEEYYSNIQQERYYDYD